MHGYIKHMQVFIPDTRQETGAWNSGRFAAHLCKGGCRGMSCKTPKDPCSGPCMHNTCAYVYAWVRTRTYIFDESTVKQITLFTWTFMSLHDNWHLHSSTCMKIKDMLINKRHASHMLLYTGAHNGKHERQGSMAVGDHGGRRPWRSIPITLPWMWRHNLRKMSKCLTNEGKDKSQSTLYTNVTNRIAWERGWKRKHKTETYWWHAMRIDTDYLRRKIAPDTLAASFGLMTAEDKNIS
jgi:hypothetical protein